MTAANASTTTNDISNVMSLYAMLTGRLSGISSTLNVNPDTQKFEAFAPSPTSIGFKTLGLYASDSFRLTPQLTLNYGLRWQLDGTIHGTKPIYTMATEGSFLGPSLGNFQPGVLGGNMNPGFAINTKTYNADLVNPAPNLGIAWNPNIERGHPGEDLRRQQDGHPGELRHDLLQRRAERDRQLPVRGDPIHHLNGQRRFRAGHPVPRQPGSDVLEESFGIRPADAAVRLCAQRRPKHQFLQPEPEIAVHIQLDFRHSAGIGEGTGARSPLRGQQVDAHVAHAESQ